MGGNPDPPARQYPQFPDPGLIEALARRWLDEATVLGGLAAVVAGSAEIVWAGAAQRAAAGAAAGVAKVIGDAAGSAASLGQALEQYAAAVRKAIAAADAGFWAELAGVLLGLLTFGFGDLLLAVVDVVADLLVSLLGDVGLAVEAATFIAGGVVFSAVGVAVDFGAQGLGDESAGLAPSYSPLFLPFDIGAGLVGGLALAARPDGDGEVAGAAGAGRGAGGAGEGVLPVLADAPRPVLAGVPDAGVPGAGAGGRGVVVGRPAAEVALGPEGAGGPEVTLVAGGDRGPAVSAAPLAAPDVVPDVVAGVVGAGPGR